MLLVLEELTNVRATVVELVDQPFLGIELEETQYSWLLTFEWRFRPRQSLLVQHLSTEGLIDGFGPFFDHSADAAGDDFGIATRDSLPPAWSYPMFRPSVSRVPLIFVWPGRIAAGQRFSEEVVSMIDVLPTILELVGLPRTQTPAG